MQVRQTDGASQTPNAPDASPSSGQPQPRSVRIFPPNEDSAHSEAQNAPPPPSAALRPKRDDSAKSLIDDFLNNQRASPGAARVQNIGLLRELARTSNVSEYENVKAYVNGGLVGTNAELHNGVRVIRPETRAFLDQLHEMHDYTGVAYRESRISDSTFEALKNGERKVFCDSGVASMSVLPNGAPNWTMGWAMEQSTGTHDLVAIYDDSVRKKNLASDRLPDHVATEPGVLLKVRGVQMEGDRLVVAFSGTDISDPDAQGFVPDIYERAYEMRE